MQPLLAFEVSHHANLVLLMFATMITHYTVYENECFGVYFLAYMVKKNRGLIDNRIVDKKQINK